MRPPPVRPPVPLAPLYPPACTAFGITRTVGGGYVARRGRRPGDRTEASGPDGGGYVARRGRRPGDRTEASGPDGGGYVALTFDDGPHPQGTPAIMEALAAAGARATFFLVGEQVERRPALAAELVAAGHEVALHGHRHRAMLRLTAH